MKACLSHKTALRFWRTKYAARLAGSRVPFYKADTPNRPRMSLPARLPHAPDISKAIAAGKGARAAYASFESAPVKVSAFDLSTLAPLGLTYPCHVLISTQSHRSDSALAKYHVCATPLPPNAVVRLSESLSVAGPELTFLQAAETMTLEDLVALGFELCGYYSVPLTSEEKLVERRQLTSVDAIASFLDEAQGIRGVKRARRALEFVLDGSASPMETATAMLLTMPPKHGGYGLTKPQMNGNISLAPDNGSDNPNDIRTCDLLWRNAKLDVEYNGGKEHEDKAQRTKDARRPDELGRIGFECISLTVDRLRDEKDMDLVAKRVAKRLGLRLRPRCSGYEERKARLRGSVIPADPRDRLFE